MHQVYLNARVYAKQKINLTWPKHCGNRVSGDLTRSHDHRVMWFYEWQPLMICQHPAKFGGYRRIYSGYIMVLVCPVILQDHETQEPCDFLSRSPLK